MNSKDLQQTERTSFPVGVKLKFNTKKRAPDHTHTHTHTQRTLQWPISDRIYCYGSLVSNIPNSPLF